MSDSSDICPGSYAPLSAVRIASRSLCSSYGNPITRREPAGTRTKAFRKSFLAGPSNPATSTPRLHSVIKKVRKVLLRKEKTNSARMLRRSSPVLGMHSDELYADRSFAKVRAWASISSLLVTQASSLTRRPPSRFWCGTVSSTCPVRLSLAQVPSSAASSPR